MAKVIGILGLTGNGKSTSIVVDKEGKFDPNNYGGLNPKDTIIIEADRKDLPFPPMNKWIKGANVFYDSSYEKVLALLKWANAQTGANGGRVVKNIVIDTINGMMLDKEADDIKKKSYDKWLDLAMGIYGLVTYCNTELRDDIIVFLVGHTATYEDTDGNVVRKLVTNGKKLEKICIESKLPIVLHAITERQSSGQINKYLFETQACKSTAKSPIGMFDDFIIPNSLKNVEDKVREYYAI